MNVIISPNINKTSERIDKTGNIIDPKTGQIIKSNREYVPTAEQVANMQNKTEEIKQEQSTSKPTMEDMISKKINEIVEKRVEEKVNQALEQALEKAFKNL